MTSVDELPLGSADRLDTRDFWDIRPDPSLNPSGYFRWKGWIDRPLGIALLMLSLPLMAVLIFLVRATSRGPSIYPQTRVGKDGRWYKMFKIRTMIHGAEDVSGPVWTNGPDPRITFVGRFLRWLHLDELPQLANVARGEMSLIGPRPERPEFVEVLATEVPGYLGRLSVLPGISGLAQANLPTDDDVESVRQKVTLDREYIEQAGLLLDLRLGMWTLWSLSGIAPRLALNLLRLEREVGADPKADPGAGEGSKDPVGPKDLTGCGPDVTNAAPT